MSSAVAEQSDREIARRLFFISVVAYLWFFQGGGWNQNSTLDLTRAMVEEHTFQIDHFAANTGDLAYHRGHQYSNKSPGMSVLAVPPYLIASAVERVLKIPRSSFSGSTITLYVCTVGVAGISGAVLVALIFLDLREHEVPMSWAVGVALVAAFGTYLFAYSTLLFAHVPSALFLFWSWVRRDRPVWSGAAAGVAVACYYGSVVPLLVIAIPVIRKQRKDVARFIAGGLPFLAGLLLYQWICFGSPLASPLSTESAAFKKSGAFLGLFLMPRLSSFLALTFFEYRGLVFLSPVLLLAFAGAIVMIRSKVHQTEAWVGLAVFFSLLLFVMSFNYWHGGWSVGPRYLLQCVPFLTLPLCHGAMRWPRTFALLAVPSFAFNFLVTAVNPQVPNDVSRPVTEYAIPLLMRGTLPDEAPRQFAWARVTGYVSVNPTSALEGAPNEAHPMNSAESFWASFNLGELVWPGRRISLLPILLWMACGAGYLRWGRVTMANRAASSLRSG